MDPNDFTIYLRNSCCGVVINISHAFGSLEIQWVREMRRGRNQLTTLSSISFSILSKAESTASKNSSSLIAQ